MHRVECVGTSSHLKTPRAPGSQAPLEISCTSHWSAMAGDMGYSLTSVLHVDPSLSILLVGEDACEGSRLEVQGVAFSLTGCGGVLMHP